MQHESEQNSPTRREFLLGTVVMATIAGPAPIIA